MVRCIINIPVIILTHVVDCILKIVQDSDLLCSLLVINLLRMFAAQKMYAVKINTCLIYIDCLKFGGGWS